MNVNIKNKEGETPMDWAVEGQHAEIIKLLSKKRRSKNKPV